VASSSTTRSNLAARYAVDNSAGDRATSAQSSATDMDNKAGWYMDLPQSGERIVNRTQLIGSLAVVTTLIPKVKDLCNTVPSGAVMFVDPFTGANQGSDLGLGTTSITYKDATGKTVTTTVAINGKVFGAGPAAGVTGVMNGDGTVSLSFNTLNGGLATLGPIKQNGISGSRVSWRELTN
jgi:type IV pilus assembly protein PilY1